MKYKKDAPSILDCISIFAIESVSASADEMGDIAEAIDAISSAKIAKSLPHTKNTQLIKRLEFIKRIAFNSNYFFYLFKI